MAYRASAIDISHRRGTPGRHGTVLFVSHQSPFPPRAGNERRLLDMTEAVQSMGFRTVNLVCPLSSHEAEEAEAKLGDSGLEFVLVHPSGRVNVCLDDPRAIVRLIDGAPITDDNELRTRVVRDLGPGMAALQVHYTSSRLVGVFDRLVSSLRPQAVIANYSWTGPLLDRVPRGTLRAVDTHDVLSSREDRVRRFSIDEGPLLTAAQEGALLSHADVVIAIQEDEAVQLRRMVPSGKRVITCGISFAVRNTPRASARASRLGLIGSANVLNVEGLHRFLATTWKLLIRGESKLELIVAGPLSECVPEYSAGVRSLGPVEDVTEFYRLVDAVVNPVVAGSGLKIKTVESVAHGRRVVSWPEGAAGLNPALRPYVTEVSTGIEFAGACQSTLASGIGAFDPTLDDDLASSLSSASVYQPLRELLARGSR